MNKISFVSTHSLVNDSTIAEYKKQLLSEHKKIKEAFKQGYASDYASINVCGDTQLLTRVQVLADEMKSYNPEMIIVIGIGGSSLGTKAVHEALNGVLYNDVSPGPLFYCIESVDADYTAAILLKARKVLKRNSRIIVNIVTKSGTTTETIANGLVFIDLLREFYPDEYKNYIVVTTDHGSKLYDLAVQQSLHLLEIPEKVGGRFSVLSAVGLFPLALVGIDIVALRDGANSICKTVVNDDSLHNDAALSAIIKYVHYKNGIHINDMFLFSLDCAGLGQWYRQLMGESLGKLHNRDGKLVEVGITPTVSVGTIDLHSVGQLYLGGPRDKFITFIHVDQSNNSVTIPHRELLGNLIKHLEGKTFDTVLDAILQGVVTAYSKEQRPYATIGIPEKNAYYIGQFLQTCMFEIMYLGSLLEVNTFDQPQVELYKQETRKILAYE